MHHFIRDHALKGDISIEYVDTHNQLADNITIRRELGMIDVYDE